MLVISSDIDIFITDFYGWGITHYFAYRTGFNPERIYSTRGGKIQEEEIERLTELLRNNDAGLLVLFEGSRFSKLFEISSPDSLILGNIELRIRVVSNYTYSKMRRDKRTNYDLKFMRFNVIKN